jgi:hypothetical protein
MIGCRKHPQFALEGRDELRSAGRCLAEKVGFTGNFLGDGSIMRPQRHVPVRGVRTIC